MEGGTLENQSVETQTNTTNRTSVSLALQKLLERKFPKSQVLQRPADGGKMINYLEAASVVQRLNEVFAFKWSLELISEHIQKDEIVVRVRLKVLDGSDAFVREAFGGVTRKHRRNGEGYANALADDLKAAQSDAFKKAASLLGIGLYLYSSTGFENQQEEPNNANRSNGTRASNGNQPKLYTHRTVLPTSRPIHSTGYPPNRTRSAFGNGVLFNTKGKTDISNARPNQNQDNLPG